MRTFLVVSALALLCACQRTDPATASARVVAAPAAPAPVALAAGAAAPLAPAQPVATPPAEPAHVPASCGASCAGHCDGSCMAGAAAAPAAAVPADARWAELHVEGMHCGGCARRIQAALAQVDGVVGSEVDLGKHVVRVAVRGGADARALATPAIDRLGYRVVQ